jgi:DNA-directed RNA polymerase subunit beta
VLAAFLPWWGHNDGGGIVVSERLVREGAFASVRVDAHSADDRPPRRFTRFVLGVSPDNEAVLRLGESGAARVGARARAGDILVGAREPRGEDWLQSSPERRLLGAVFGEGPRDFKDPPLRLPAGAEGVVAGARLFRRGGPERRRKALRSARLDKGLRDAPAPALKKHPGASRGAHFRKGARRPSGARGVRVLFAERRRGEEGGGPQPSPQSVVRGPLRRGPRPGPSAADAARVFVASLEGLSAGGVHGCRQGGRWAVSKIIPEEDMPFLENGTPADVEVSPRGLCAGQILEARLGRAGPGRAARGARGVRWRWRGEGKASESLGRARLQRKPWGAGRWGAFKPRAGEPRGLRAASPALGGAGG